MANKGTATISFGAFPGTDRAEVTVSEASFLATMYAEAWIRPEATADHSEDEIMMLKGFTLDVTVPESRKAAGAFVIVATSYDSFLWGDIKADWAIN